MRKILWALLFLSAAACGDDSTGNDATTGGSGTTTGTGSATTGSGGSDASGGGGAGEGAGGATASSGSGSEGGGGSGDGGGGGTPGEARWVGTWGTGPQLTEPHNNPPEPGLSNNTLRQVVYTSIGGSRIRLRLSNEFGNGPVTMNAVHIANAATAGAIDAGTDKALTFSGAASVTIPQGQAIFSDPIDYALAPLTRISLTIQFGNVPTEITGHPGSRTTSYIKTGDAVSDAAFASPVTTDHWYYITGLDVVDPDASALVVLGDSITDGRGSITNENTRWPDYLSRRLRANEETADVAVLNMGIGGNTVLTGGLGPTAIQRFQRDVLDQRGARYLIIYEGVNDIGGSSDAGVASRLIEAFSDFIDDAHAADMLVYGVPILPFGGNEGYDSPAHQQARDEVNEWIRTSNKFDAVIDLDAAVRDPNDPTKLLSTYDTGDHLHLNPQGYEKMAESIDLELFTQ
ncbi:SGNH/GDSL hydrolase family protein [Sorangium sp. So ce131]|uniref:SGNH/GDSL hydrolase family protein n=1 Tax=Sorangium sp. So ce131 TaxID=3133282 RepID=UPI003F60D421